MTRTVRFSSIVIGAIFMMVIRLMLEQWWPQATHYYPDVSEIFWYIGGALAYWSTGTRVEC